MTMCLSSSFIKFPLCSNYQLHYVRSHLAQEPPERWLSAPPRTSAGCFGLSWEKGDLEAQAWFQRELTESFLMSFRLGLSTLGSTGLAWWIIGIGETRLVAG